MPTIIWVMLGLASLSLFLWFVAQGKFGEKYGSKKTEQSEQSDQSAGGGQS